MSPPQKPAPTLYGIAAFKLVRGLLVMLLAVKGYTLIGQDLRPHFDDAVRTLRLDPETEFFDHLGNRIDQITPVNVGWAATGAMLYGLLSLAEGIGLTRRARWAGSLVIAESGFFVPIETYALIRRPSVTIVVVLLVNVAIVVYLYRNRVRLFTHP